jgi:hypothetical protein
MGDFNSPALLEQMRHNFSIVSMGDQLNSQTQLLYYCVRCKWGFRVDGSSGAVTALGFDFKPLKGIEAYQRLESFAAGPCPVFARLLGGSRSTQLVGTIENLSQRVRYWIRLTARRFVSLWLRAHCWNTTHQASQVTTIFKQLGERASESLTFSDHSRLWLASSALVTETV